MLHKVTSTSITSIEKLNTKIKITEKKYIFQIYMGIFNVVSHVNPSRPNSR